MILSSVRDVCLFNLFFHFVGKMENKERIETTTNPHVHVRESRGQTAKTANEKKESVVVKLQREEKVRGIEIIVCRVSFCFGVLPPVPCIRDACLHLYTCCAIAYADTKWAVCLLCLGRARPAQEHEQQWNRSNCWTGSCADRMTGNQLKPLRFGRIEWSDRIDTSSAKCRSRSAKKQPMPSCRCSPTFQIWAPRFVCPNDAGQTSRQAGSDAATPFPIRCLNPMRVERVGSTQSVYVRCRSRLLWVVWF